MQKSDVDAGFRVLFLIWAALLLGVTLLTAVVWALTTGLFGPWRPTMQAGVVKNLLAAPVLLMAAGIFYRRGDVDRSGTAEAYLARYQARIIVASAMQEGGGLLGLVLCMLAGMSTWAVAVWGLTAVAMVLSRPRRADLDRVGR
ncbi:MAG TPA: hypothetical protein VJ997_12830 [Longimicrobiales bacterium]|nr:hypothetical protein [Longimicrobiales bacterium]